MTDRRPLESLEREITELASHIHAAMCRWLMLIGEFDRREGWAQWGFRSCAHWVSWRCSIAPVAAREHVRVARRLEQLPSIRGAFAHGRLSYSKVRALTRVESVVREEELLELARHASAAQLERLVRAYRGVVSAERAAAGGRPERWLDYSYDDDGSLLLRARLPAEEGAVVLAALEAARDRVAAEGASAEAPQPTAQEPAGAGASAEAPRPMPADAAGAAPQPPPEAEEAGVEETSATVGEARADALLVMADSLLASGPAARSGGDRHQVVVHVDAATLAGRGQGERCELADGAPLAAEAARRIACDAGIVSVLHRDGRPLGVGRKTRSVPPALRRALASRNRGCRFPGCDCRHVDAHHIEHWAHGGATDLRNLVQLCRRHHRLLHEGGYRVERAPGGEFTFRRPDGRRIAGCPVSPPAARTRCTRHGMRTGRGRSHPTPASRCQQTGSTWRSPSTPSSPTHHQSRQPAAVDRRPARPSPLDPGVTP